MDDNFEQNWFFACMTLAQNEMLESTPLPLDYQKVIFKAKQIYKEGFKAKVQDLFQQKETVVINTKNDFSPGPVGFTDKIVKQPIKDPEVLTPSLDVKICPGCGEEIPLLWKKHRTKKSGDKCGYEFD
jgi:hypothetical protein